MADPEKKTPDDRPAVDPFGVGFLADGKLDVVTPAQHAQRVIEREAEEAVDDQAD